MQIRFRLRAVVNPQFREGFAIAVFRSHAEVARDGVQTPARLAVAKLPRVAEVNQLVAPITAAPQPERHLDAMLPRPPKKKGQIKVKDVESQHWIHTPHLAPRRLPKFRQRPRLIIMADDEKFIRFQVEHPDGDDPARERVERRLVEKVAAMIRLGFGNLLRNFRGIFQVARFNFRRVERWE